MILSGGAFNSPQVLLRSGVGDPGELESHDIAVVHDLPGVGRNLQDHLNLYIQYACKQPVSYYPATRPLGRLKVGLQWWLRGTGLGASNLFEAGAFFRSRPDVPFPNLQHHFFAIAIDYNGNVPVNCHAFQVDLSPMRPTSRGQVWLRSRDPREPPRILFNHLRTGNDREEMRDGLRLSREMLDQPAMGPYRGRELSPGEVVQSDTEIDSFEVPRFSGLATFMRR